MPMRERFTEEQIDFALGQEESGTPVPEVRRKIGITEVSFYRWKRKFQGMGVTEVRRLRMFEEEILRRRKEAQAKTIQNRRTFNQSRMAQPSPALA